MHNTKNIFVLGCLIMLSTTVFAIDNPYNPTVPNVSSDNNQPTNDNKSAPIKIEIQRENSFYTKGRTSDLSNFRISGLTWVDNEKGPQSIRIEYVKSIRIKGYTTQKTTKDNLSVVFYFPYLYDIVLTDGRILKDAVGKIKEIDNFILQTESGSQKCYTYFVRYWLEDKGQFAHNGSKNLNEKPEVPDNAVIYIEFPDNNGNKTE